MPDIQANTRRFAATGPKTILSTIARLNDLYRPPVEHAIEHGPQFRAGSHTDNIFRELQPLGVRFCPHSFQIQEFDGIDEDVEALFLRRWIGRSGSENTHFAENAAESLNCAVNFLDRN